jgi:uncharacterized phage protein gp47/JayE
MPGENGVSGVTNAADWLESEGADEESDASLRRRYTLEWRAQAGVTRAAYERAALSVVGVAGVRVADQHPRGEGTVDVIVIGEAGMPTEVLLQKVRAALDAAIVINHDLLVKAPVPVAVDAACDLELVGSDPLAAKAAAEAWIASLFAGAGQDAFFGIGVDVIRDRITSGLITLPGVKRVLWTSPENDLVIPYDGLAALNSLSVATTWVEPE